MDPITAIGLASAIITFVDFGSKVIRRLEELSEAGDVPKAFREIKTRLPLIITTVDKTRNTARTPSRKAEEAMSSIIESCHDQVRELEEILQKFTAEKGESSWKKGFKATLSMFEETRVQRIESALRENIQVLTFFNMTPMETPTQSISKRVVILPFERDSHFIGRENVLASIGNTFQLQRRVAITGIGGVGFVASYIKLSHRTVLMKLLIENPRLQLSIPIGSWRKIQKHTYSGSTAETLLDSIKDTKELQESCPSHLGTIQTQIPLNSF